jgi:hypothetical protein
MQNGTSNLLSRNPQGRFMGGGEVIDQWLPVMLDQYERWSSRALKTLLDIAASWCLKQSAKQCRKAGTSLLEYTDVQDGISAFKYYQHQAGKFLEWRTILLETIVRLDNVA